MIFDVLVKFSSPHRTVYCIDAPKSHPEQENYFLFMFKYSESIIIFFCCYDYKTTNRSK